jgi:hypothetical protein
MFFVGVGRRRQIRRINEGDRLRTRGPTAQQRSEQMSVDDPQAAHAQHRPQIVEQRRVGNLALVGQARKATPGTMLTRQLDQQIEAVSRG